MISATPNISAPATALSGAQGGSSGPASTGAFNVTKGTPSWVWIVVAVVVAAMFLWRPRTNK